VPAALISRLSLWMFRLTFAAALAVTVVVFVFFVWGLLDGSVSSFNMSLWLILLAVVTVVPLAGWALRASGKARPAILVLSILAVPGLIYALFLLLLVITGPSWR
jgi:hypothetical protein